MMNHAADEEESNFAVPSPKDLVEEPHHTSSRESGWRNDYHWSERCSSSSREPTQYLGSHLTLKSFGELWTAEEIKMPPKASIVGFLQACHVSNVENLECILSIHQIQRRSGQSHVAAKWQSSKRQIRSVASTLEKWSATQPLAEYRKIRHSPVMAVDIQQVRTIPAVVRFRS